MIDRSTSRGRARPSRRVHFLGSGRRGDAGHGGRRALRAWLAGSLAFVAACAPHDPSTQAPKPGGPAPAAAAPRDVRVAVAARAGWERVVRATGELRPAEVATLATKVSGRLLELTVDVGSRVKRGEVIARVDERDYALAHARATSDLAVARADLGLAADADAAALDPESTPIVREARALHEEARREHARQKSLVEGGATTQAAVDVAAAAEAAAESRLAGARETIGVRRATLAQRESALAIAAQALKDTQIAAPFDGVIAERLAGTGDFLAPGTAIARVLRDDPARLVLSVPEQQSAGLGLGALIRARFDSGVPPIEARVARLGPQLTAGDRSLSIEADVVNPAGLLRPGSFVRAEIVIDPAASALAIPPTALVRFAGIEKVFVVEEGTARERRVRIGRVEPERLEVLEGLKDGERVVLEPGDLQGGARLNVIEGTR